MPPDHEPILGQPHIGSSSFKRKAWEAGLFKMLVREANPKQPHCTPLICQLLRQPDHCLNESAARPSHHFHQLVMMMVMMAAVVSLAAQVFFRIFVKGSFAARGAEIIHMPIVFRLPLGRCLVDFHFTYWIYCHDLPLD